MLAIALLAMSCGGVAARRDTSPAPPAKLTFDCLEGWWSHVVQPSCSCSQAVECQEDDCQTISFHQFGEAGAFFQATVVYSATRGTMSSFGAAAIARFTLEDSSLTIKPVSTDPYSVQVTCSGDKLKWGPTDEARIASGQAAALDRLRSRGDVWKSVPWGE